MANTTNPPDITATAFACPYCNAYTTQYWFKLGAERISGSSRTPGIVDNIFLSRLKQKGKSDNADVPEEILKWFETLATGSVALHGARDSFAYSVGNLHISECFNCKKIAVWIYRTLIYPAALEADPPNPDLPAHIQPDYNEARAIYSTSPRGAAALLRLCIQKLCKDLGESGKDLNADIANLVAKGLNGTIQKALDIVRVVGNEAVHPGVLDLRDDLTTASRLFGLVNLITEQMITMPEHVKNLYDKLPEEKKKAIEQRDGKKK